MPMAGLFLLSQPSHNMVPVNSGPGGVIPEGWTGNSLLGFQTVFVDNNIPAARSNARLIVCNPANVFVLRGEPYLRVIPETLAENLEVVIQLVGYLGVVVRHSNAIIQVNWGRVSGVAVLP